MSAVFRRNGGRLLLFLVLVLAIGLALHYRAAFDVQVLTAWVRAAGPWAPLLFVGLYAIGTLLFLPGSVLTLAGGVLFGPVYGVLYNLTGATLGAGLAFLAARYLASDWVAARAGGRLRQLLAGVEVEGWRFVAFVRLVPLFPFNLLNYALGLTRIPFVHYLWASWIFMLPASIAYTYVGYAGREALAGDEQLIYKALLALGLLGAVAFLPRVIGRMRERPMMSVEALHDALARGEVRVVDVRTRADFDGPQGHIPGALNIPLEELPERMEELVEYEEAPLALVCHTDRRSRRAALLLAENGFAGVHVVRGGMTDWTARGLPVERS